MIVSFVFNSRQQSPVTFPPETRLLAGSRGNGRFTYESPFGLQGHLHGQRSRGGKGHGNVCKGTAMIAPGLQKITSNLIVKLTYFGSEFDLSK